MFYVMHDSTVCMNHSERQELFNKMCHTLNDSWDAEHALLANLMDKFGYTYKVMCYECGTDYEWCVDCECPECPECPE